MNLYELTSEQLYINQLLEENGGELTEELVSLMEVNETNFNDKIEGYCKAIKIMESNLTGVESEIERLQKMKKTYKNSIDRMKETMKNSFVVLGKEKVTLGNFKVSLRNSKAISIIDEDKLPESVFVMKKEVSKTAIKDLLEQGEIVEGAEYVENKSIQIK